MMRIAAIDVGRNSIHMMVAEARPDGHFIVLDREKEMVRLGERSLTTGRLQKSAMDRGLRTLKTFQSIATRHGVTRIRAVATSAVRETSNDGEIIGHAPQTPSRQVEHGGRRALDPRLFSR